MAEASETLSLESILSSGTDLRSNNVAFFPPIIVVSLILQVPGYNLNDVEMRRRKMEGERSDEELFSN